MKRAAFRTLGTSIMLTLGVAHVSHGQAEYALRPIPELRADVIRLNGSFGGEFGGGVQIPLGYYTRIGITAAGGAVQPHTTGRLDLIARFLFDPFLQQRWGLSAGGGISLRARSGDHVRPYLLTVIDLEGPHTAAGVAPALQLGLGGGLRLGGALRWGAARNR